MWQIRLWRDLNCLNFFIEKQSTAMTSFFSSRSACVSITLMIILSSVVALIAILCAKFPNETLHFTSLLGYQNRRNQLKTIGSISLSQFSQQRSPYFEFDYSTSERNKFRRISEAGDHSSDSFVITVGDSALGK